MFKNLTIVFLIATVIGLFNGYHNLVNEFQTCNIELDKAISVLKYSSTIEAKAFVASQE